VTAKCTLNAAAQAFTLKVAPAKNASANAAAAAFVPGQKAPTPIVDPAPAAGSAHKGGMGKGMHAAAYIAATAGSAVAGATGAAGKLATGATSDIKAGGVLLYRYKRQLELLVGVELISGRHTLLVRQCRLIVL
jgi:hypothetical protein